MHQDKDGQEKRHKKKDMKRSTKENQDITTNNMENSLDKFPIILQILRLFDTILVDMETPLAPIAGSVWGK